MRIMISQTQLIVGTPGTPRIHLYLTNTHQVYILQKIFLKNGKNGIQLQKNVIVIFNNVTEVTTLITAKVSKLSPLFHIWKY